MKRLLLPLLVAAVFLIGCASHDSPLLAERDFEQNVLPTLQSYKELTPVQQSYVIQQLRLTALQEQTAQQSAQRYQPVTSTYTSEGDSDSSNYRPTGGHIYSNGFGGYSQWNNDGTFHNYYPDGNGGFIVW